MRMFITASLCSVLTATAAYAENDFTFSIGLMQRSYSADVPVITNGFGTTYLTSGDTETTGISLDAHLVNDFGWVRFMAYSDDFDASPSDASGIGFPIAPASFGLFGGAGSRFADFERQTGLFRFDAMTEVAKFNALELYAGGSLVSITDEIGATFIIPSIPGTTTTGAFDGRSEMVGAVLGGRYDILDGTGSNNLTVSAFGTLGLYHASHSMQYTGVGTGLLSTIDDTAFASTVGTTGAVELGVTASYSLSEMSEVTFSYQAAYYGDAVTSPESIAATNNAVDTTAVFTDSVLYHGVGIGLNLRF